MRVQNFWSVERERPSEMHNGCIDSMQGNYVTDMHLRGINPWGTTLIINSMNSVWINVVFFQKNGHDWHVSLHDHRQYEWFNLGRHCGSWWPGAKWHQVISFHNDALKRHHAICCTGVILPIIISHTWSRESLRLINAKLKCAIDLMTSLL